MDARKNTRVDARVNTRVDAKVNTRMDARVNTRVDARLNTRVDARLNTRVDDWVDISTQKKEQKLACMSPMLMQGQQKLQAVCKISDKCTDQYILYTFSK